MFYITSIGLTIAVLILLILPKWKSIKALGIAVKIWASISVKIFGIKIKIYGAKNKVKGSIVSNHISPIDILLLGSIFSVRFTPKNDLMKWPILGRIYKISRPVWINRTSKLASRETLEELIKTLSHGINLAIFPEGTSTYGKGDLYPFKTTIFEAALKVGAPIYPVLIIYENDSVAWPVEDSRPIWQIFQLYPIKAELYILEAINPKLGENRKDFSKRVYGIMNKKYQEIRSSNIFSRG